MTDIDKKKLKKDLLQNINMLRSLLLKIENGLNSDKEKRFMGAAAMGSTLFLHLSKMNMDSSHEEVSKTEKVH